MRRRRHRPDARLWVGQVEVLVELEDAVVVRSCRAAGDGDRPVLVFAQESVGARELARELRRLALELDVLTLAPLEAR